MAAPPDLASRLTHDGPPPSTTAVATAPDRLDPEVAKYATAAHTPIGPAENARLKRMVDKRVLSVMVFTYFLQALDKGSMSFASLEIRNDLDLNHDQRYPWLTTCIYLAVLVVEYPTNYALTKLPIAKYLGISIILWGTVLALHASARSFAVLLTLRTLLGTFEAVCQPAFLLLSSMWYKRSEQASAVTYWYMMNGMQQIVGGLLAYSFALTPRTAPLRSWQAMFITYGGFSVLWGVFVLAWLPDSPMRARCFSEADKAALLARVRGNRTGVQNRVWKKEQALEALRDPQTWAYGLIQLCTTLPTSGLGAFANIIISSLHFTTLQTQLLAMVLGAVIIGVLLSATALARKTNQTLLVMAAYVTPSIAGTVVLMSVRNTGLGTKAGLLVAYYAVLSFWAAQTLGMSMVGRNVGGVTKRSVAVAMNFVWWAVGNAIGPQVFLDRDKPRYFIAFATHMGCYALLLLDIAFLRWYLNRENERKDAAQGLPPGTGARRSEKEELEDEDEDGSAFEDLTDRENPRFRYVC
ncbi:MFS general substrate transporter [Trichodelitschia bisporula]|uniref:MFS general substrate transporter n=1 Tax=Trichodelitschia bisporula TaxID=703511 RepID=A0A6G1HMY6_9PEZI|nr:MFS general substrate transporter [Trichodelitschia bisporula]